MRPWIILLLLAPVLLSAQAKRDSTGTYHFSFGKKKPIRQDSIPSQEDEDEESKENYKRQKKEQAEKRRAERKPQSEDYKKDGIFKGLFIAGLNACQIDGDNQWGYKYFGAEAGIGGMARLHRFFSLSLELDYTMKGAKDRLQSTTEALHDYEVQWDYVAAPIAMNAHFFHDFLSVSAGFSPAVMVRYKEFNDIGQNVTGISGYGQPHIFDLGAFAGIQLTFKKHYAVGFKYSYSTISIRHSGPGTRVDGQYNNVLTLRFVYILGPVRKK